MGKCKRLKRQNKQEAEKDPRTVVPSVLCYGRFHMSIMIIGQGANFLPVPVCMN